MQMNLCWASLPTRQNDVRNREKAITNVPKSGADPEFSEGGFGYTSSYII